MEAAAAETRAQKAERLRPELFRLLLDFDPPEEERTEAERLLIQAKAALQAQIQAEQEAAAAAAERWRIEEAAQAQREHDRRPLSPGFCGCCSTTREGGGLPEGGCIPARITHDLVLLIDGPARRMEREERLLAMHGGDVNKTLGDVCWDGGGKDARFLLAHGADANYCCRETWTVLWRAAWYDHLAVVEVLLDAGAHQLDEALVYAAKRGHPAVAALLLDRGADVHFGNDSALWSAAREGHLQTATLLLDRGADADVHPAWGDSTALQAARGNGHHEIVALLLARGADDEEDEMED
jgi:Ankyrin repeats (3 copies)/Ankyrin repeats (many copies)